MFKKFSVGQMVYVDMYDSVGEVVVIADDGDDIWYGVECLDGKFGIHNCDGYDDEIIEIVEYPITGNRCEWFMGVHLEEFDMASFLEKRGKERIDKLKYNNSDALFKSEYLDWIHLNLSFSMKDLDGSLFWDDDYFYRAYVRLIDSGLEVNLSNMEEIYCKSLEEVLTYKEMKQCVMRHKFNQVRISITYCSKYYDNEFEKLFNFFKPYIEETDECLGEIHDEDGYIRKDYYLDDSIYNRIIEKQKLMCEGCPGKRGRQENVKCENYEFCSVAYDNGMKNKSL